MHIECLNTWNLILPITSATRKYISIETAFSTTAKQCQHDSARADQNSVSIILMRELKCKYLSIRTELLWTLVREEHLSFYDAEVEILDCIQPQNKLELFSYPPKECTSQKTKEIYST